VTDRLELDADSFKRFLSESAEHMVQRVADRAAKTAAIEAVQQVFQQFGIDVTDKKAISEYRATFEEARERRSARLAFRGSAAYAGIQGLITFVVSAGASLVTYFITTWKGNGHL